MHHDKKRGVGGRNKTAQRLRIVLTNNNKRKQNDVLHVNRGGCRKEEQRGEGGVEGEGLNCYPKSS
jgi:hypothetical protein